MNYQKKDKAISRKGLTTDLINEFCILNGAKCFSSGIFQNYLVFIPAKKYIKYFSDTIRIESWKANGMSDFTLDNCVFGSVKLTKNADPDKYKYSGYGIEFNFVQNFCLQMEAWEEISLFLELI